MEPTKATVRPISLYSLAVDYYYLEQLLRKEKLFHGGRFY